ncbi:MAG: VIT and VWA domain-containing protein [Opitutaceae bacterium]|nr:VIT and VWA domain-containing protein [Opitutaceae bacterium]
MITMHHENTRIGLETRQGFGEAPVLKSVRINGRLDGLLLDMRIRQRYRNESARDIEAVYTFPLAWGARLMALDVEIGGKKLRGAVVKREQARRDYEEAIDAGDTPVMVEASAPGLFTANLGNIKPGEDAVLELRYAQLLRFEQGRVRLGVPTVIAPRYGDAHAAGGLAPHETAAASLAADYPLELRIELFGDIAAAEISSPSHAVNLGGIAGGRAVSLAAGTVLDRDFILVLDRLAGRSFAFSAPGTTGGSDGGAAAAAAGHTVLASFCPALPRETTAPLLLKILVDCSSSMGGDSIASARCALHRVLAELDAGDYVSLSRFGSQVEHERGRLEPCTPAVIHRLSNAVSSIDADLGGTEMRSALLSTLNDIAAPGGAGLPPPAVLLITDGEVWGAGDIIAEAGRSGHRIFAVGVGSAPAETLHRELAEKTGGACELVSPNENIADAIVRMFHRMRGGAAVRVRVDWGAAAPLWQSAPPRALYDGETVHLFAQFARPPEQAPQLCWEAGGAAHSLRAGTISAAPASGDSLPRLAGAQRMAEAASDTEKEALALQYQLVSEHTNLFLVHVREGRDKAAGLPDLRQVPQMLAAGWGGAGTVRNSIRCDSASICFSMDADSVDDTYGRPSILAQKVRQESFKKAHLKVSASPLAPKKAPRKSPARPAPLGRPASPAARPPRPPAADGAPFDLIGRMKNSASGDVDAIFVTLLETFDQLALRTTDLGEIVARLSADAAFSALHAGIRRLAQQHAVDEKDLWAMLLDWLVMRGQKQFSPSRQTARLLRRHLRAMPEETKRRITAILPPAGNAA